jgi:hypothetical protein
MNNEPHISKDIGWSRYYSFLFWAPIVVGSMLPFIFFLVIVQTKEDFSIKELFAEYDELLMLLLLAIINDIPFAIGSFLARRDFRRNQPFEKTLTEWAVRFVPVFLLYLYLFWGVSYAIIKRLPGASTAPISIVFFPVIGIPLVLVGNCLVKRLQKSKK